MKITIDDYLEKIRRGLGDFENYIKVDYKNEYVDRTPAEWHEFFTDIVNEFEFDFALTEEAYYEE